MPSNHGRRMFRDSIGKTRSQMIKRLNDGMGVTHPGQGPPRRAQTSPIPSTGSGTELIEQDRQRLDLLEALATLMHILVVAIVLKQPFRRAAELFARNPFQ